VIVSALVCACARDPDPPGFVLHSLTTCAEP
jgi:hypothetical protein